MVLFLLVSVVLLVVFLVLSMEVGFSDGSRLVAFNFSFFPAVSAKAAGFISLNSMMSVAVLMFLVELPIGIYLIYFHRRGR